MGFNNLIVKLTLVEEIVKYMRLPVAGGDGATQPNMQDQSWIVYWLGTLTYRKLLREEAGEGVVIETLNV